MTNWPEIVGFLLGCGTMVLILWRIFKWWS
jgi:hypothetical protein